MQHLYHDRFTKLNTMKAAASIIRNSMAQVQTLRTRVNNNPNLGHALHEVKTIQARRFAITYHDLLNSNDFKECAEFFLTELYSERDYSHRDEQFARVAGAIEVAFPDKVMAATVHLAKLHLVTETLDVAMAEQWCDEINLPLAERYLRAWKALDSNAQRQWQLNTVLLIGRKLGTLTRQRGLHLLLKMMRRPAAIAGLSELQLFLEAGFERFKHLSKRDETLQTFLQTIQVRESEWIRMLNATSDTEARKLLLLATACN